MFDPKEPNGIQHLRSHLRSRLNSKVTERDRTGVVANAILNGQTTTPERHGMLVRYKLEMKKFDSTVETQFKEKIESQLKFIHDDVIMNSTTASN